MNKVEIHSSEKNINNKNNQDKNHESNSHIEGGCLITIIFYVFGVATLTGTNGMLNQLNFVEFFQYPPPINNFD